MKRLTIYKFDQVIAASTKAEATVTFDAGEVAIDSADDWVKLMLSVHFNASSPGLAAGPIDGHMIVSLPPGSEQHFRERVNDLYRIGFRAVP
jgi:hypothetical protein